MDSFSIELARAGFLALLLAVPCVIWLSFRSLGGLGRARATTAIVLRCLAVALIALALARLRVSRSSDRLCVYFVADRSFSILPESWDSILETIRGAQEKLRAEDEVGLVLFGREAGIERSSATESLDLTASDFRTLIYPEATDIQSAIRLAVAAFPEGVGGKRLVVFSDGNENRGDVATEVRNARSLGVTVDVVAIDAPQPAEIWVEKLVLDPEAQIGQPLDLQVVVQSTQAAAARLFVYDRSKGIITPGGLERELEAGKNVITIRGLRHDTADFHQYEVRVEPVDPAADRVTQNNAASAFVLVSGEPKVLIVLPSEEFEAELELERPLLEALTAEKIGHDVVPAERLPRDAGAYLNYDAIVFSNVAAHELTEGEMKLVHGLVEGVGIGFVMLGGKGSFGAGGYQGTPIERLLPVDMDVKQKKTLPNGALAVVVHSCELANGNWWAQQIVQRAIRVLSPKDYCGVLYHDDRGGERWLFPMWECSKRSTMLSRLRTFQPGDMMSFQQIFSMALTGLQATPASIKHMIILSDGDPAAPRPADVKAITTGPSPVTISTICYGAHGNTIPPIMRLLAQEGGGKFYHLTDPRKLPEIFLREAATVRKSLISNDPFYPVLLARGPVLQGVEPDELPVLGGYVLTSAKSLADLLLVHPPSAEDPSQDPVLATWSYGLGKSVAFTSDARTTWGAEWIGWSKYRKIWTQMVRWVSRKRGPVGGRVTRQVRGETGTIIFDAIDETTGELDTSLRVEARVVTPDHETHEVVARQTRSGRYEIEVPAETEGTYTVTLRYERDGEETIFTTGLSVPYSPEFRHRSANTPLLRSLAESGQGRFIGSPAEATGVDFFSRDFPRAYQVDEVWRELLIAALLCFFADVFVRRVMLDFAAIARRLRAILARFGRGRVPAEAGTAGVGSVGAMSQLLERKQAQRARDEGRRQTYEASPGEPRGLDAAFDASAAPVAPAAPSSRAERSRADREKEPAPEGEPTYTRRLLDAKRRALKKQDDEPEENR